MKQQNIIDEEPKSVPHSLGRCPRVCSLETLLTNESGVLERIELEEEITSQLLCLGLTPGRRVEILKTGARFIVEVAGSSLALDRKLVSKIYVVKELNL